MAAAGMSGFLKPKARGRCIALNVKARTGINRDGISPQQKRLEGGWMTSYAPESNHNGKKKQHTPKLVYPGSEGLLFQGDCLMLLHEMASDSVHLAFADPPFNLGKNYGTDSFTDRLASEQYRAWCQTWLMEMVRVLKPGGALFLYHWPKPLMELGAWLNTIPTVQFRNWIALKMKAGFPIRNRLHPAHYGMLYYVKKGAPPTFNVVRHRAPTCRHCGGELRDYGGYRKKFEKYQDQTGIPWIQVSDFWEDTRPERSTKSREETINELPMHIPERAILVGTNPGDVVLDVFGGSGSTYHAAQFHQRKWIGCEIGDVQPILRRLHTCFGLTDTGKNQRANALLSAHFKTEFAVAAQAGFIKRGGPTTIAAVQKFENSKPSFHANASKSKILGY